MQTSVAAPSLEPLSQSDLTVRDPAEDIRDRAVLDRNRDEVGTVQDLLIDTDEQRVRFLQVGAGGFLGIGEKTYLVPVDAITRIEDDGVHIDQDRNHVAGGPTYQPDLALTPDYVGDIYGYYGYAPYWGAGYAYPPYPFYPR